jgi:hypothetical protein
MNYPIAIPTASGFTQQSIGYVFADSENVSQENLSTQKVLRPGVTLRVKLQTECTEEESQGMELFMMQMKGIRGSCYYTPIYKNKGTGAGTIVVSSSNAPTYDRVLLSGGTGNAIVAGDWIQIGTQLCKAMETYSGSVQWIELFSPLRAIPSPSEPVVTTAPKGVFRLVSANQNWETSGEDNLTGYNIELREAF